MNGNRTNQEDNRANPNATWTSREAYLLALVCLLSGVALGYLFRGSSATLLGTGGVAAPASSATSMPPAGMPAGMPPASSPPPTAEALQPIAAPMLTALKADPKNVDVLIQLANLYYDHKVYTEAITYYNRALELQPKNVNVRTDLGTAYWYTGDATKAVAEYEKSLKYDPSHSATLMNMGIVKLNGLNDADGAIAAWEKLLKISPQLPEKQKVLDLIAQAKAAKKQ